MRLWQVSWAGNSRSLIGHLSVTFGGAPNCDVADSLDAAYLGPFIMGKNRSQNVQTIFYQDKKKNQHIGITLQEEH